MRNASIDLLKIFAMFMIVSVHILGQGGGIASNTTVYSKL